MSRITNDGQFQFLISCIRHSNNGKIDYTEVAKECSIVSRGAAVKRYSRLMKAHGISTGGEANTSTSASTPTSSTNNTPKKPKFNGKRKTTTDFETDPESNGKTKASKRGKKAKAVESAEKIVKSRGLGTVKEEHEDEDMEGEILAKVKGESEDSD